MDTLLQAIILGIIEGLTEFLPISSTGHLLVAEELMNYKDTAKVFTIVIQFGAIAAVVWHFRHDLYKRIVAFFTTKKGRDFALLVVIATMPAVIAGVLLESLLESSSIVLIASTLIAGGFVLLHAESVVTKRMSNEHLQLDAITRKQALCIGLAQVLSLVPGVSRSGSTILGAMYSGINRPTAAAFSFYLSIPIIVGASGYKLIKDGVPSGTIDGGGGAVVAGTLAAFVSALVVVTWLIKYVSKHSFKPFAYYRIALGSLLLVLVATGLL